MKQKSLSFKTLLTCVILALAFVLASCSQSPYDIAVKNGFTGSEAEWVESLKGTDGAGLDIYDIYDAYLAHNPGVSFNDFLKEYLTLTYSPSQTAVSSAITGTVSIISTFKKTVSSFPFGGTKEKEESAAGSGVIYRLDAEAKTAYIITNYHVIYDFESTTSANGVAGVAGQIRVNTYAKMTEEYAATVDFVGGSMPNDIAVLRVTGAEFDRLYSNAAVKAVKKGDSDLISVGESVYAVGNPEALGISATAGVVSVDSEVISMKSLNNSSAMNPMRVVRVDAAINGGNSGGGLYNNGGELVGIVNAKIVDETIENIGYAIPSNVAFAIADTFIDRDGKKSIIGISTAAAASKTVYAESKVKIIETVRVESVSENSLAAAAGIKTGDFIQSAVLKTGGTVRLACEITRYYHLADFILNAVPNETLSISLTRDGTPLTVDIKLEESKRVSFNG